MYDSATLNGTAMQNAKGQLAEAWTCTGGCSSKATDAFFSLFPESGSTGRLVAQVYEMTPHSNPNYYLTQDTYYPNGVIGNIAASLNGSSIGVPSMSFGLGGMGRPITATDTTHSLTLTSGASYNAAGNPTGITLGNGDSDSFQYDSNTYRPTQFKYNITGSGAFTITGNLTWNPNWSLQQKTQTDTNDSSKNQTCNYSADDLQRIASVNCATAWEQTFSYDAFGNIKKTANPGPGQGYLAGYNYVTNRVNSGVVATYDANGNQTQNTFATFAWNAASQPVTVNGIGATYDALGRMVETVNGSTYTEYLYRPSGDKLALLNGTTLLKAVIPLPGGASAVYNSSGLNFLRHKDWLGSSLLTTTWAHGIHSKEAHAPFGETYNEVGTSDRSFTGQDQDTTQGIYDFMFRRYDGTAGRWLSPDPAGWAVVDQDDPQSMNRYAYVENDPMTFTDAFGLDQNCQMYGGYDYNTYVVSGDIQSDYDEWIPYKWICTGNYNEQTVQQQVPSQLPSPFSGPDYSQAQVCAASALLNRGGPTVLDAVGVLPAIGNLGKGVKLGIQIMQHAAAVVSLGLTIFGASSPADAVFTGTGTGLTAVDDAKVMTEGAELVPVVGNGVSAIATARDIWGQDGIVNYYRDCIAGKN